MVSVRRTSNKPELWAPGHTLFDGEVTAVSQATIDEAIAILGIDDPDAKARFGEAVQAAGRQYLALRNDVIDRPPVQFYRAKAERLGNAAATLLELLQQDPPYVYHRLYFESMRVMGRPLRSVGGSQPESFEHILETFVVMCRRRSSKLRSGPQEHVHIRSFCADVVDAIESAVNRKFTRNLNAPGGIFKSSDPRALQLLAVDVDPEIRSGQISTALKAQGPRKGRRTRSAVR